jgi:hypothetical protein
LLLDAECIANLGTICTERFDVAAPEAMHYSVVAFDLDASRLIATATATTWALKAMFTDCKILPIKGKMRVCILVSCV